ncbi:T25N20.13 [Arabidopsis thaliana]|jgi:hypothetical protein|uniref:T25N20.13 n=1 Tax=Arabidopsis thaliana TaxID=3702 RepID=Q9LR46_ARATH|nr:T25N20.13 [Arabidopsis thaliana]
MTAAATTETRVEITWPVAEEDTVTDAETTVKTWLRNRRIIPCTTRGLKRPSVEESRVLLPCRSREISIKLCHRHRDRGRRVITAGSASSWSVIKRFSDKREPFLSRSIVFSSKDISSIKRNNLLESELDQIAKIEGMKELKETH